MSTKYCTDCRKPFANSTHNKCATCDKTSRLISGAMRCKSGEQACTRCFQPRRLEAFVSDAGEATTTCEGCRNNLRGHRERMANRKFSRVMASIPTFNPAPLRWAA